MVFNRNKSGIRTALMAPSHSDAVTTGERRSDEKVAAAIRIANDIGKRIKIDSSNSRGKSNPPRQWPAYNRTVLSMLAQSAMFSDETKRSKEWKAVGVKVTQSLHRRRADVRKRQRRNVSSKTRKTQTRRSSSTAQADPVRPTSTTRHAGRGLASDRQKAERLEAIAPGVKGIWDE